MTLIIFKNVLQMCHTTISIQRIGTCYKQKKTLLKALVNIVVDRLKKNIELSWLTCIILFKWMNKRPRKKEKKRKEKENHAFTMKLSMNFLFFVVYNNNYSTVVCGGNVD